MNPCTTCGAPLGAGARFCISCGHQVEARDTVVLNAWSPQPAGAPAAPAPTSTSFPAPGTIGASAPAASAATPPADAMPGVRLAPGEVLKRVFPIASVRKGFGSIDAQLAVTDSRLLYRARARNGLSESVNFREVQIADVSGMAMVSRRGMTPLSLLTLVLGFLLGWLLISMLGSVISAMTFSSGSSPLTVFLFLVLVVVTVAIAVVRFRSTEVALVVYARGIEASPIALSGSFGRQQAGLLALGTAALGGPLLSLVQALGFFDASDASDSVEPASAQELYDELGPLILDLQSRGVMGGE